MTKQSLEDKLIDLETKLAFQDDTIDQLNQVLIKQQQQIDQLIDQVTLLKQAIAAIMNDPGSGMSGQEKPPHY
ncbi:SlyX family protein [Endozoicomonas sp. SM1973]|uniref:Protein SlyX homolog n=1 Tax=Spartinivicinus marinus TaxID=2994442 RepID=A0A853IBR1_9GAMM|nr:SlyX family protein [Spartinivicinus marinus]MCX4028720.1 SlyX family protein [Spartinivicinus marinus]NYZ68018.1 SlyX family protein [Spartinivicinus marinus]